MLSWGQFEMGTLWFFFGTGQIVTLAFLQSGMTNTNFPILVARCAIM
jgi:hypothetical protein